MTNPLHTAFLKLIRKHKLKAPKVAELCGVKPQTARTWMCGTRPVPTYAMKLLTLQLT